MASRVTPSSAARQHGTKNRKNRNRPGDRLIKGMSRHDRNCFHPRDAQPTRGPLPARHEGARHDRTASGLAGAGFDQAPDIHGAFDSPGDRRYHTTDASIVYPADPKSEQRTGKEIRGRGRSEIPLNEV
ncbi:hypothetical protein N7457_004831 [Penicillium paradoxum]|uniref:uncharacterized protein n=1 Tax=Penicillium paradoxum TaxID=176176 RepID=UPI0025476BFA|nr:uncharacterized protein N7457_004831 [Penicillium paradoxum]KAJ5783057.1 hypothetical protein N7457_004831 [Penicillium paradoxum]